MIASVSGFSTRLNSATTVRTLGANLHLSTCDPCGGRLG